MSRFPPKMKWADAFSIHPPTAQTEHARDLKFCKKVPRGNRLGMIEAIFDELKFGYFWSPRDILANPHISAQGLLIKNRLDYSYSIPQGLGT